MSADAPLSLHHEAVDPAWIDYNGHMNLAYYVLVFDHATDALMDHVGLDAAYRARTDGSLFVVESHVTYGDEVMQGEDMAIATRILDVDHKRLRLFHEMAAGADRRPAATNELMILHVDLSTRRTAPFPDTVLNRLQNLQESHARLTPPPQAGRGISFATRRAGA